MKPPTLIILALAFTLPAGAQLATLTAPDPSAGASVLLISSGAALGAPQANNAQGAVYLYPLPVGSWKGQQTPAMALVAADGQPGDLYGSAMATAGSQLIVGAPGANGGSGAVYVYVNLVLTQELTQPGACGLGADISTSLSDANKFFVSSPACNFATLYEFDGSTWHINQQWTPAQTVAIGYGEPYGWLTLATGVPGISGNMGKVIVDNITWRGDASDFGSVISMQQSGNLLFVGEPAEARVYIYFAPNHAGHPFWQGATLVAKLTDSSLGPNSGFGSAISARGKAMLIGAPGAGTVDLFEQPLHMWSTSDSPARRWQGAGGAAVAVEVGKLPQFISAGQGTGYIEGVE